MKNMTLSILQKDTWLQYELKQEGSSSSYSTLAGNMRVGQLKFFSAVYKSTNDHKSTVSFDLRVTNKFLQVGKFTNTKSMNNEV